MFYVSSAVTLVGFMMLLQIRLQTQRMRSLCIRNNCFCRLVLQIASSSSSSLLFAASFSHSGNLRRRRLLIAHLRTRLAMFVVDRMRQTRTRLRSSFDVSRPLLLHPYSWRSSSLFLSLSLPPFSLLPPLPSLFLSIPLSSS